MEIPKFRNHFNVTDELLPGDIEVPVGESETIPGQAYSVKEILTKFVRGIDPRISKEPIYTDATEFDDIDPLYNSVDILTDVTEAKAFLDQNKASLEAGAARSVATTQPMPTNEPNKG